MVVPGDEVTTVVPASQPRTGMKMWKAPKDEASLVICLAVIRPRPKPVTAATESTSMDRPTDSSSIRDRGSTSKGISTSTV